MSSRHSGRSAAGGPSRRRLDSSSSGLPFDELRSEWPQEPRLCKAVGCNLCGADFDSKEELVKHWRYNHLSLPELEAQLALSAHRIEEEMRTRLFYDEYFRGPFEVRGQEMRGFVGTHAEHET